MCGIAGFFGPDGRARVAWMTRQLAHRGPDDEGVWSSPRLPLALGNRRLKILDLSPLGHQPMVSPDGRHALTYNGEIYNHVEVKAMLEGLGHSFRSTTDTEVLLQALIQWGVGALAVVKGMFAFALWDEREGTLTLARDRLGIKPLYYACPGDRIAFGSEIKAVLASGLVESRLDPEGLRGYLRLLWVPEPRTLLEGVLKLPPGCFMTWRDGVTRIQRYWDVPNVSLDDGLTLDSAVEQLQTLLLETTRRQLRSDVPVGILLSGGLDSTAILRSAVDAGATDLRTYSIAFRSSDRIQEGALDDARFARLAASSLGASHTEIRLTPDVVSLLPKIVRHLEDPVADPAAINTYLLCQAARETSTVLLSGAGGDELFGGYTKYVSTMFASRYQERLPGALRRGVIEPLLERLPVAIGSKGLRSVRFAKKFAKYASAEPCDRFIGYSSYYDGAELEDLLGGDPHGDFDPRAGVHPLYEAWEERAGRDLVDSMTYVDLRYYLPGLGLLYADKAGMAASAEIRVPLLDESIVNLVASLPARYRIQGFDTKILLRRAMKGRIPDAILDRPKAPFSAPLRAWLRGDLGPLVDEHLDPGCVLERGLFNPGVVRRMVTEHRQGREDHSLRIWALLTLETWLREFCDGDPYRMPATFSFPRSTDAVAEAR
jgi:asparagine synthase (glutamine-hydrolysing)